MMLETHDGASSGGTGGGNRGTASGIHERDAMQCRACGNEERASEGYPCASCGTFLCLMCVFKGVVRCAACMGQATDTDAMIAEVLDRMPPMEWPED